MLSIWHILILLLVVVVVFGTSKLRNIGSDLGAAVHGFKKAMNEGEQEKPPQTPPPTEVPPDMARTQKLPTYDPKDKK